MAEPTAVATPARPGPLSRLDQSARIEREAYDRRLKAVQTRLVEIYQAYLRHGHVGVVVMEGWDAAGKGGIIRRMSAVMDPRSLKVWPIAAPTAQDLRRHYLARFWERLPPKGEIGVFDRSWYGRLLVERVEGFASTQEWGRAFGEINEFERLLTDSGARIAKIFLSITPQEQLKRFGKRLDDPLKRWKLSYEDFRNREKWAAYEEAANEMLERTSTESAPWKAIAANDKHHARIEALEHVAQRLADGVDLSPPEPDPEIARRFAEELRRSA